MIIWVNLKKKTRINSLKSRTKFSLSLHYNCDNSCLYIKKDYKDYNVKGVDYKPSYLFYLDGVSKAFFN